MPASPGPNNGPYASVAALFPVFDTITFVGAGSLATRDLHADGLPGLNAWFLQTVGGAVVSVQLQFADGVAAGGVPDWQPLVPAYVIALNTPSLTNPRLGSRRYRAVLTSDGATSVKYRLTASLS